MPLLYSHHGWVSAFLSSMHTSSLSLNSLNKHTDTNCRLFSLTLLEPYTLCGKKGKDSTTASSRISKSKYDYQLCSSTLMATLRSTYLGAWKGKSLHPKHPHNARKEIGYPWVPRWSKMLGKSWGSQDNGRKSAPRFPERVKVWTMLHFLCKLMGPEVHVYCCPAAPLPKLTLTLSLCF